MRKITRIIEELGLFGSLILIYRLIVTRIFYPSQKIIRHGNRIRGKKFIHFTSGLNLGVGNRIDVMVDPVFSKPKPHLFLGKNVEINDYCHIACVEKIEIGDNVLIASKVFITDHNHGGSNKIADLVVEPKFRRISSASVIINSNVWIGEGVVILPGVVIGRNSIIGAGAVVTKNIPEFAIAVGVPAKVIKQFNID